MLGYADKFFDNLLINGGDGVAQRYGEGFASQISVGPSFYFFDRWLTGGGSGFSTGQLDVTDPIGGPGLALSGRPVGRVQRYEVDTAEAAPAANQVKVIQQHVEGTTLKVASAMGKSLFKSYWINATPGLNLTFYVLSSDNGTTFTHSYVIPFTTVGGYQRYSFVIPPQILASIHEGTGIGHSVGISFHTGTTRQTSDINQWTPGTFVSATGESNFMDTIGNFIEIDQAMLLSGERFSTDFANNINWVPHAKAVGGEVRAMERYYEKTYPLAIAPGSNIAGGARGQIGLGNLVRLSHSYRTPKRVGNGLGQIYSIGGAVGVLSSEFGDTAAPSQGFAFHELNMVVNDPNPGNITGSTGTPLAWHYVVDTEL